MANLKLLPSRFQPISDKLMQSFSVKKIYILFPFLFIFIACQTATEQLANAKYAGGDNESAMTADVPEPPKPGEYTPVKLSFTDTNNAEARLMIRRLDSFYQKQVAGGFNGSVLVGYKGKILYERYLGYANRESGTLLGPTVASQLASTSKPFTATAILWLYQNKYLDINAPVQKYLTDFPYANITVKMLLCHRSGLPDYVKVGLNYWKDNSAIMYNEDVLQVFKNNVPRLNSTPGTKFEYSNSNYAMLARIIEEVSAMSYAKFMKEFIFQPLGMTHTFIYDPNTAMPANRAISYKYNWTREPDMFADGVYGDKGIYSTVEDMYRWDQSFYNHTLLDEKTLQMAYAPQSFEKPGVKNYGLGWRMMNYPDGYKIIYHNGWWHGNNTVFYRFVQDNLTIIVLGNKYNSRIYGQAKPVYDIIKKSSDGGKDMKWEEEEGEAGAD